MSGYFIFPLFSFFGLVMPDFAYSQTSYSIRGIVTDEISQEALAGALVYVVEYETMAVISNENGEFRIDSLPVGRHRLLVSYLGYASYSTTIEIKSGKELVLQIQMKEEVVSLDEVVVTAKDEKSKPVNSLAYASTRTFSVEESNKFAGAVDDPARMAQSFAGVVPTNDGSNYISIRGNHPSGLLYRMEGIDIPNPNHFGDIGSSGGGVSVLSSQMLANSDFSTGAFSSEYGNALGGVFDIRLRKGNNTRHEYTLKAGILGLEAAVEGPLFKSGKGSYLINYRYSTLSLIDKLGVDLTGVLNYSDLSYHIHLPLSKADQISLFGINGWSNQKIEETLEDLEADKEAISHRSNGIFLSNVSVNGAKYSKSASNNGFINAIIAYSTTKSGFTEDVRTAYPDYTYFNKFRISQITEKIATAINYTQKIRSGLSFKAGLYYDRPGYRLVFDDFSSDTAFTNLVSQRDQSIFVRTYGQLQYRFHKRWTANAGMHYSTFLLNHTQVAEPRGNIQFTINGKSNIALAYGQHSQLQPLIVYFVKSTEGALINKNLDFTKAHHLVLTYNLDISAHTRFRSEMYYQYLTHIPVGEGQNRNYAIINQQFFFPDFKLINEGKGKNIGMEVTLERFLHHNWYYIVTASIFDSKYKTPSGSWLNTRYNTGYTAVVTLGKEWQTGQNKQNTLGINLKSIFAGGQWETPIDRVASQETKSEVRDEEHPFSIQLNHFYKLDIGIKYKRNKSRHTTTWSLDLMNATNHTNIGGITYDVQHDKTEEWTMMPFIPVFSYKVEF